MGIIRNIFVEKLKFVSKKKFWRMLYSVQIQVRLAEQMCIFFEKEGFKKNF